MKNKTLTVALMMSVPAMTAVTTTAFTGPAPKEMQPKFSKPLTITNPYLPLSHLHQDILAGTANGQAARVERIRLPQTKHINIGGRFIVAMIVEDRDFSGGKLEEDTLDYFAQADDGTVYYLGERVDAYKGGKIVGHGGSWLAGGLSGKPGVLVPAHPYVGQKFQSENMPGVAVENDEVMSLTATVTVPAGTFHKCLKIRETADGEVEYKYYAPNVGVVKEVPTEGPMVLKTHQSLS